MDRQLSIECAVPACGFRTPEVSAAFYPALVKHLQVLAPSMVCVDVTSPAAPLRPPPASRRAPGRALPHGADQLWRGGEQRRGGEVAGATSCQDQGEGEENEGPFK
jgi:hypothetical protein